jgi:hypothetical protein
MAKDDKTQIPILVWNPHDPYGFRGRIMAASQSPQPSGSDWIDRHRSVLPENEWVASDGQRLVANDKSIDGLMNKIRLQDINESDLTISFITADSV